MLLSCSSLQRPAAISPDKLYWLMAAFLLARYGPCLSRKNTIHPGTLTYPGFDLRDDRLHIIDAPAPNPAARLLQHCPEARGFGQCRIGAEICSEWSL